MPATRTLVVLLALLVCASAAGPAPIASAAQDSIHSARQAHGRRVGGHVRKAWPQRGHKPATRQARWLARQVGATKARPCAKRWRTARRACHVHPRSVAAAMRVGAGDPGSPPGGLARIAAPAARPARDGATAAGTATIALPLQLARSYEIPVGDPSYTRLLNWSWTYDSAVSAAAFAATGDKANAAQLLDQLAALQHKDGSLEIAFDTETGESAPVFRSGTDAWVGLAEATYDKAFGATRYLDSQQRMADYLLSLQTASGLIKGGPTVDWTSTQHNLIAYTFLVRLGDELQGAGSTAAATRYRSAAAAIAAAITAKLLVTDASGARFRQGLGDDGQALDVQALGALFLQGTGQPKLAAQVLDYAQRTFAVADRSVKESAERDTYNLTYAASGPFSGYAPYAGEGAPDVLWEEGSGEMRLAQAALGIDTDPLDKSIAAWSEITKGQGALQADRTVTNDAFDVEYHAWPASTAAAWTVLAQSAPAFFAAPLPPATSLVTSWTKIRGGNLIATFPDGRVDMILPGGERRVLAGSATAADYTVTSNATLLSGAGYGIYVRATADAGTKLTGYCVQADHGFGQVVVRELQSDFEVSTPLARGNVPAGFAWYGVPHVVGVTVSGTTMSVVLDGTRIIAIPDLAAASATAVKSSSNVTTAIVPPAAGGYGLRAWSDGLVSLQQMTVGPG